jgi:hypothetical protein
LRALPLVFWLSLTNLAFADDGLPSDAAQRFLAALEPTLCMDIPVGPVHLKVKNIEPFCRSTELDDATDVVRKVSGFERIGVVKIVKAAGNWVADGCPYQIDLTLPVDGKEIGVLDGRPCLRMWDLSNAHVNVSRTEPVMNFLAHWSGVVAYLSVQGEQPKPLFAKLVNNASENRLESEQFRVLFRLDPFAGKWRVVTYDSYIGGNFDSDTVPRVLIAPNSSE